MQKQTENVPLAEPCAADGDKDRPAFCNKFATADELERAYDNLQREFTKKCQQNSELTRALAEARESVPSVTTNESGEPAEESKAAAADIDPSTDPIAQSVLECAADAYGVDISTLTMATDIREDLSNESMKMIVMISEIEDELDVTIEIQEASLLNTLADFVLKVKEKM